MPDPTLQELPTKSCNSIGGNFFYIHPIVLTCPPVTITCSGPEKDTQRSTLRYGHRCSGSNHNAMSMTTTELPHMWYWQTRETVGCLSEHPWGIYQTTCMVHTVCLFNKQPLSNIFSIYTSPFLVMQIPFCGDSKVDHENGDSTLLWYTDYTDHNHTPSPPQDKL
jgi:hypothetical protein